MGICNKAEYENLVTNRNIAKTKLLQNRFEFKLNLDYLKQDLNSS